jgi:hypothetical protein
VVLVSASQAALEAALSIFAAVSMSASCFAQTSGPLCLTHYRSFPDLHVFLLRHAGRSDRRTHCCETGLIDTGCLQRGLSQGHRRPGW